MRERSALEVLFAFLKLGLTSFGGPIAHIGYFREEIVVRRHWLGWMTPPTPIWWHCVSSSQARRAVRSDSRWDSFAPATQEPWRLGSASRCHPRSSSRHSRTRQARLRVRLVIVPSDGSGGALISIRYAARRRADRFIDRLSRLLISTFIPWSRASDILAGRTFTVFHESPQNYHLVCYEATLSGRSQWRRFPIGCRRSPL
jgi:hypothetical protein